ncbi:hypothetical protein Bca52824_080601 [Brassica carinata]|uniref:DUF7086 domain-containing protein n=1 Tax=Brassica carinata TaxID=52824 RepID=A0A8X7PFT5_BRACI|nr:hypothetical protein Bca52824_080601 [Brassica carinata]
MDNESGRGNQSDWEDDQTNQALTNDPQNDGEQAGDDDDDARLPLSLSLAPPSPVVTPMMPHDFMVYLASSSSIPPPFPWATNKRGTIQSLENLESKQITTITGEVQCRHCEKVYQVSYNLRERFSEVENVFVTRKKGLRERAHPVWTNPEPVRCELCGRDKAVKPVIADRKRQINWLFLLLGQTLGYCTLEQLRDFCKHSKSPRTGAKDRVLYLTYLGLCKMLEPNRELFNRDSSCL